MVARKGHGELRMRVIGAGAYAWAEMALMQGAHWDELISDNPQLKFELTTLTCFPVMLCCKAHLLSHRGFLDGLVLVLLYSQSKAEILTTLLQMWKPYDTLFDLPGHLIHRECCYGFQILVPATANGSHKHSTPSWGRAPRPSITSCI